MSRGPDVGQKGSVLQVVILKDGQLLGTEVFAAGTYSVGRDPGCDLVLDDPMVSGRHARLHFDEEGRATLTDEGSSNGLYVNGARTRSAELKAIDDVEIRPFVLKLRTLGKRPVDSPSLKTVVAPIPAKLRPPPAGVTPLPAPTSVPRQATPGETLVLPQPAQPPAPREGPKTMVRSRRESLAVKLAPEPPPTEPVPLPARAVKAPRPARPPKPSRPPEPLLRIRISWGDQVVQLRSFTPGRVRAAPRESAALPLYGFDLKKRGIVLARHQQGAWRLSPPPGATLEALEGTWKPLPVPESPLELPLGMRHRLVQGPFSVELVAEMPPAPLPRGAWLDRSLAITVGATAAAIVLTLLLLPPPPEKPDFQNAPLPMVRAILKPPTKQIREAIKKAVAKKEAKLASAPKPAGGPKKEEKNISPTKQARQTLNAVSSVTRALAKLQQNSLLNAVSGAGKGKRQSKVSGLLGSGPIQIAGLGKVSGIGTGGGQVGSLMGLGGIVGRGGKGPGGIVKGSLGRGAVSGGVSADARSTIIGGPGQGQLDRNKVQQVILDHMGEVQSCYERALMLEPGLKGKLVVEWTIDASGRVSSVKQKQSTLANPAVASCVFSRLKGWHFDRPRGGSVVISFPFVFAATGA